jgi:hypothetical protein
MKTETFRRMHYTRAHKGAAEVGPVYSAVLEHGVEPAALLQRWNDLGYLRNGVPEWSYTLTRVDEVRAVRGEREWDGYARIDAADCEYSRGGWVFLHAGRI